MLNDIQFTGKEYNVYVNGRRCATISNPDKSSGGQITVENKLYSIPGYAGVFSAPNFQLNFNGEVLATIEFSNTSLSKFRLILTNDREYTFKIPFFSGARFPFTAFLDGNKVGEIFNPLGAFQTRPRADRESIVIDLPDIIPLPIQLFVYWCVLLKWGDMTT